MASTAARPLTQTAPSAGSGPSTASKPNPSTTSSSAQQPTVSLLGTLPLPLVPSLLRRIESSLITLPPTPLCEKETVLSRHDDSTSGVRETGDNAWASVVKARRGVKLRLLESVREDSVECTLHLPLPSLPERQYPKASVRPSYTVSMLSDSPLLIPNPSSDPFEGEGVGFNPETLDTDAENGWKSFTSSIGWRPHFTFLRYGLSYPLNETISRHSSTASPNPLNPSQTTKYALSVYRIFQPDPTGFTSDWTPLDPEGSTVIVEFTASVGGQIDQSHFNQYCSPTDGAGGGGMDPNSTVETAIEEADAVARTLRGLVDLRREAYD